MPMEESQSVTIHYMSRYQQDPRGRCWGTEQGREKQLHGQEAAVLQGWHLPCPATGSILEEMDRASAPWHRVCCGHSSRCRAGERTPLFPLAPTPAYNSPHSCSSSGVAAADCSIQLQNEEKEAHDYIMDFVKSTRKVMAGFVSIALCQQLPVGCCHVCCLHTGSCRAADSAELFPSWPPAPLLQPLKPPLLLAVPLPPHPSSLSLFSCTDRIRSRR